MQTFVEQTVKNYISNFKFGIIFYEDITISDSPQMLKGRIRLFQESLHIDLENKEIKDITGVTEWRSVFKQFGTDPTRYRPSVEALFRRLKKGQFLDPFNSAVDLNNFFSLKYEIPLGIYDLEKLQGSLSFSIGEDQSVYDGLNGREISMKNMLHTADHLGPFGSPFVDSRRTAVSETTKSALHVVYFKPSMEITECKEMLEAISKMFVQVHGGTTKTQIIN
ncbi:B3/B4 domain-containing protein [Sutcliffiella deserti]|uniref:B3/B4 domain-containing protein n=1 Tax=Sutcliffiella deserti TaxID=2875501 RepID=UPI001CBB4903|nr:phenylalanine--tRNA ligase beta subunit-related protein [Sutcliffiella deserti]